MLQFAFIGLIVLHPEKMGFSSKPQDIERLIYFWRCVGHMLGIEDRYNLCCGDYATVRHNCQQVFERSFKPKLLEMDKAPAEMCEQIVVTANHYIVFLRYRGLLKYLFEVTGVETEFRLDKSEHLFYLALKWVVGTLAHYRLWAFLLNNLLRFAFYRLTFKSNISSIVRCLEKVQKSPS